MTDLIIHEMLRKAKQQHNRKTKQHNTTERQSNTTQQKDKATQHNRKAKQHNTTGPRIVHVYTCTIDVCGSQKQYMYMCVCLTIMLQRKESASEGEGEGEGETAPEHASSSEGEHAYLLLSRSDSTMVLQTGQEIAELDSSGFATQTPTVCAGNLGGGNYIVQVNMLSYYISSVKDT